MPFTLSDISNQIDNIKISNTEIHAELTTIKTQLLVMEKQIKLFHRTENPEKKIAIANEFKKNVTNMRGRLIIIFYKESSQQKEPSSLEQVCYDALIMLTTMSPLNEYNIEKIFLDPISKKEITKENKVPVSSGCIYDINTLAQFMDERRNFFLDPQTHIKFKRLDQENIKTTIQKKNISSQLILSPISIPTFYQEMLDSREFDVSGGVGVLSAISVMRSTENLESWNDIPLARLPVGQSNSFGVPLM